jgi:hypothetical protein
MRLLAPSLTRHIAIRIGPMQPDSLIMETP